MKRLTALILLSLLLLSVQQLPAQNTYDKNVLSGSWYGKLEIGIQQLRVVFNLKINDKDSLSATLDSPDQGAKGIPLGKVILNGDKLTIQAPMIMGEYLGTIKNDTTIDGTWTQGGKSLPLIINKLKMVFSVNRPQEPEPPFPYISEEVTFQNNKFNISLAGTLTIPQGEGPFPAAIMITGSGPENRDEEIYGHKPFLVISDWLTRNGIAVLRYDDRGVGKSTGTYSGATSADLSTDAVAAFNFLKNNNKINPKAIGLMGHSEGGLIAPIVASANPDIAFIVSLAGPGVTGEQILNRQTEDIYKLSGVSENNIKESIATNKRLYSVLKKENSDKKAEVKILAITREILEKKKLSKEETEQGIKQVKATFDGLGYSWLRYFITTDAATFWKKVKCPVLALNGEKDLQVAAEENLREIEKAVESSGNKAVKTIKLPGLNHLFQHCTTGLPSEYAQIEETFSPEALKIISDWISGLKVSR
jgi:alpha/beta superfamily hydrolase